jgi:hypothetical protein
LNQAVKLKPRNLKLTVNSCKTNLKSAPYEMSPHKCGILLPAGGVCTKEAEMACTGLCHVEQHEWEGERVPGHDLPYNGAPHSKPGAGEDPTFPATATDAEIWKGEDFSKYTELGFTMTFDYSQQWQNGVNARFPEKRRLDCKSDNCICELKEEPTVIDGWSRWRRYEVYVPYVVRQPIDGSNPPQIKALRILLKGVVQHRKRILRGICRPNPNIVVVTPPSETPPESD